MEAGFSTLFKFVTKYFGGGADAAEKGLAKVEKAATHAQSELAHVRAKSDAAANGLGKVNVGTSAAAHGLQQMSGVLGQMDGRLGQVARGIGNFMTSVQTMGAIGAIVAAAQMAIDQLMAHGKKKADEMVAAAEKAAEKTHAALDRLNGARLNAVKKELDEATVKAKKAADADMKAFRKAVNGYGGKGKIDEYAQLMRAGDEEGMQERLAQWRRNSRFTPQVEQMVKAAAADQNRNAAEAALANIEKNTADLAAKLDELLSLK